MSHRKFKGFTLVEMIVVVAMAGVLAAIALPLASDAMLYARQKEAKIALAGMYGAERAMFAEWFSFSMCLRQIGYDPTVGVNPPQRYYRQGFLNAVNGNNCGPLFARNVGVSSCMMWDFTIVNGAARPPPGGAVNPCAAADTIFPETIAAPINPAPVLGAISQTSFTLGAAGVINNSKGTTDAWTINEQKVMTYVSSGF
jgi:prepilin-type N-terminal cleavage/methylation domain-containing protein